jgi:hypothetical protein
MIFFPRYSDNLEFFLKKKTSKNKNFLLIHKILKNSIKMNKNLNKFILFYFFIT